jgi:hypothetical protein
MTKNDAIQISDITNKMAICISFKGESVLRRLQCSVSFNSHVGQCKSRNKYNEQILVSTVTIDSEIQKK